MTITVLHEAQTENGIPGTQTIPGQAYKLVKSKYVESCGRVYLRTFERTLINVATGVVRRTNEEERFVEVDLVITVKEKL